ncbi:hypothetical protein KY334_07315 [Candidatus Woesearchaeota archaeon]|nr:hypothetical protein [Candidatus Woesearchaeota archaeon]
MARKKIDLSKVPSPKRVEKTKKSKEISRLKIISKLALFKSIVFVSIMITFTFVLSYSTFLPDYSGERLSPQSPRLLMFVTAVAFALVFVVTLVFSRQNTSKPIDLKISKSKKGYELNNIKIKPNDELVDSLNISKDLSKIQRQINRLREF